MVKPSTDFIQLLLNEHKVFWIFIIPCSTNVISARHEQTPHDFNNTHNLQYLL